MFAPPGSVRVVRAYPGGQARSARRRVTGALVRYAGEASARKMGQPISVLHCASSAVSPPLRR
jgi:hypothetical protein